MHCANWLVAAVKRSSQEACAKQLLVTGSATFARCGVYFRVRASAYVIHGTQIQVTGQYCDPPAARQKWPVPAKLLSPPSNHVELATRKKWSGHTLCALKRQ